jgi:hypothetical protein
VQAKQVAGGATATYALVLDQGEEAVSVLSDWAASRQLSAAQVTAVGAFERAAVGAGTCSMASCGQPSR